MWDDALANAGVISTDATGAMKPLKGESNLRQACKKGHFFTAPLATVKLGASLQTQCQDSPNSMHVTSCTSLAQLPVS
jgi:hypothetical protein